MRSDILSLQRLMEMKASKLADAEQEAITPAAKVDRLTSMQVVELAAGIAPAPSTPLLIRGWPAGSDFTGALGRSVLVVVPACCG